MQEGGVRRASTPPSDAARQGDNRMRHVGRAPRAQGQERRPEGEGCAASQVTPHGLFRPLGTAG